MNKVASAVFQNLSSKSPNSGGVSSLNPGENSTLGPVSLVTSRKYIHSLVCRGACAYPPLAITWSPRWHQPASVNP
ncbi:hypothetical protein J6590_052694 [Homalodisca vitripennis]|nr:hypothetical protein J6590_052694 [Homalodisca vitripennis]